MKIAGFQKSSFVDYPKIISSVVFTPGCNMRCSYCHNKHILSSNTELIDELTVLDYLNKRKGFIKGVVISGGEPTLQADLENFIKNIKSMGYKIKLDTNGTNPKVLKGLCEKGYIDYIAMDLKAPLEKYSEICCVDIDENLIKESVEYIRNCKIDHEFRTTFYPDLTDIDILKISETLAKDSKYYLQQYRQVENGKIPYAKDYVTKTAEEVIKRGGKCVVRGL